MAPATPRLEPARAGGGGDGRLPPHRRARPFGLGIARLHPALRLALLATCAVPAFVALPAIRAELRLRPEARRGLVAFVLLAAWLLALAALAKNFSEIFGDWQEHYERSRFFFKPQRWDTRFLGYLLPARPPLFNAFAAQVLAVTGGRFAVYQVTATLWASLTFLPALLLARLWGRGARLAPTVAALLAFQLPLLLYAATQRRPGVATPDGPLFWIGLALWNIVVGVAVYGGRQPLGLAYSAQQPVIFLATAYLADRFASFPRPVRLVAAAGTGA